VPFFRFLMYNALKRSSLPLICVQYRQKHGGPMRWVLRNFTIPPQKCRIVVSSCRRRTSAWGWNMSAALTSLVTQLLYRQVPDLDFEQVMSDLSHAFATGNGPEPIVSWDCDDMAVFDVASMRLIIGSSDNLPGPHRACITVAVGPSPLGASKDLSTTAQLALCDAVTNHLRAECPSDDHRSFSIDQRLTPDLVNHLVGALCLQGSAIPAPSNTNADDDRPNEPPGGVDMDRLLHRFSSELTTRAPSLITKAIASATKNSPSSTAPAARKAKSGLFWRRAEPAPVVIAGDVDQGTQLAASSAALQTVRDALKAEDGSTGSRALDKTKRALRSWISTGGNANSGNPREQR
jgi:hypothetical protein